MTAQLLVKPHSDALAEEDKSSFYSLEQYESRFSKYLDKDKPENGVFFDALAFAYELHRGQARKSGAPYISHPCSVAEILAKEWLLRDPVLLSAALLHDVVEDVKSVAIEDIEARFGKPVAEMVDGCTKLTRFHLDRATLNDLTHRKMFLTASRRLGVFIVKLADRLHNLRTLHYLPQAKRQRIAQETVEVYAPVAAKLSIFALKRELYNLALSFLYPKKSRKILNFLNQYRDSAGVSSSERILRHVFEGFHSPVTIRTRVKGLGSYYDPLRKSLDIANSENHIDFIIILDCEDNLDCYTALGMVNSTFTPIPRTLRDFIATPKPNSYQSLHVRAHMGGYSYLIKIRTPQMDERAIYGILSEWNTRHFASYNYWQEVSDLLRDIGEYRGAGPRRKALIRLSETEEEIFTYTPEGDVHYFPKGSIVLDFAYKIHSQLGNYCDGALINGQWQLPTHPLKDGDTVEILTSSEMLDVDPDLEELCKTPKARTAINKLLQNKRRRYAREVGKEIVFQEIPRHGLSRDILEGERVQFILEVLNMKDLSELYEHIGQDRLSPHVFLYYFIDESSLHRSKDQNRLSNALILPDERNTLSVSELHKGIHKFARCCNPYPGQEDVVAVLSERGVTFHHTSCRELRRHNFHPYRLLKVQWNREGSWPTPLEFQLRIEQQTPVSFFTSFSPNLPGHVRIRSLETAKKKSCRSFTRMVVELSGFEDASSFFGSLPVERLTIEKYNRVRRSRSLPCSTS